MQDKLAWMRKHADVLRRRLMLEPRGHSGMHGALLTAPVTTSPTAAHAGLLSMHAAGFSAFSGESVIAAATIAIDNKLIHTESDEVLLDTPAGLVRARPRYVKDRIDSVALTGVPSFVLSAGLAVQLGSRVVRVDIAFGGEFYAIVDSESVGVPIDVAHAPQLIRAGLDIRNALKAPKDIQGTIFTGPPRGAADLRSATVLYGEQGGTAERGVFKRSPGLAGTCALMAVLDAMGLLADGQTFTHEGVLGTLLKGHVLKREAKRGGASKDGEPPLVIPMVEGSAWVTGRHEFQIDDKDTLGAFEM